LVEYIPEEDRSKPVRTIKDMALQYLKGNLFMDLIPLLPMHLFFTNLKLFEGFHCNFFYLVKIVRLAKGIELLNV